MEDQDVIREFLIESSENLTRLDNELVELEQRPKDADLLASIFRTFHTIKGTCGFLGFSTLEAVTHEAETILSQVRTSKRGLTPELASLVLELVDVTRQILASIEADGSEGDDQREGLRERLQAVSAAGAEKFEEAEPAAPEDSSEEERAFDGTPRAGASRAEREPAHSVTESAIRVDVGLLDKLMNLVGELVLARNQVLQYSEKNEDVSLNASSQRLNLITTELQEGVMKTRMQPIGVVWNKLPRVVRDIAASLGKQIRLDMEGAETELDKTIIEAIKDPLTHLVRNCCDHGVERPEARVRAGKPAQGRITLRAYHEGGQVNIEITDDGGGIDPSRLKRKAIDKGVLRLEQAERMGDREALHLIFHPGFSTAESVSNTSGRGVRMDVVRLNIEKIGGAVDVTSQVGEGTTVRLKIPLTLAIIPGLVVDSGGERFIIPQVSLLELIRLDADSASHRIEHVHGTPVYRRRGTLLPIAYLNEVLCLEATSAGAVTNLVVLQAEDRQFGLVVEGINDTQEIVVKPLGKRLKGLAVYAGATIMGDGRVALILDVVGVGQRSGVLASLGHEARAEAAEGDESLSEVQRLLLFGAGSFQRLAVPLSMVARLEEFRQADIEQAAGRRVVQYRDRILPLVSLAGVLEPGAADTALAQDPVQAVVFRDGRRGVGLVVDQVIDITEDKVTMRERSKRTGVLGSAVVNGQVTDFLDVQEVARAADEHWFEGNREGSGSATVLLADPSAFSRGLLRTDLEMAGYRVVEATDARELVAALERARPDVVVASPDLGATEGASLIGLIRQHAPRQQLPVLAMAERPDQPAARDGEAVFDDYQPKSDRQAMVRSIERLASRITAAGSKPAETVPAR